MRYRIITTLCSTEKEAGRLLDKIEMDFLLTGGYIKKSEKTSAWLVVLEECGSTAILEQRVRFYKEKQIDVYVQKKD